MKKIGLILSIILAAGLVLIGCPNGEEEKVTITFNATGGTPASSTVEVTKGGTIAATDIPVVTYAGNTFKEWNRNMGGTGAKLEAGVTTFDGPVTYYAIWTPDVVECPDCNSDPCICPNVVYDLLTDEDIASLAGTGGTREGHYIRGNGAGTTTLTVNEDKTLTSTGRTGSSQGVRWNLSMFNDVATAGRTYVVEYSGELINVGDTTGTPNQARLRLEGGTNPPSGNVLALSADVNPAVGASAAFSLVWLVTAEELVAMTTNASTTISLGDVRHNDARIWAIKYTKIKITEITPIIIYDLATDEDIASLAGTGGTREGHYIRGNGAGTTTLTVNEDKTLTSTGRTGSSQGVRWNLSMFNDVATAGRTYVVEYSGELINVGDTTGTPNQARLRLEGGTNPPSGNVLALSAGVSPAVGASAAFSLVWLVTAEELVAMTTNASTTISLGDVRHNDARIWAIKYTKIKITEIP